MRPATMVRLARLPFLAAIVALLMLLAAGSSLLVLIPLARGIVLLLVVVTLTLGLVPAALTPRTPVATVLGISAPVIALASYDESRLDWLRLLKDFHVASPGAPNALRLALAFAVLLLAWALHATDVALRLRASAIERGIPPLQAQAGARVMVTACARAGALAALGAWVVGAIAWGASFLDAAKLLGGRASILAPLIAVALIALAAVLLTRGAATSGEADQARAHE